jgi:ABC-type multidrug transport system ATPase subunit
MSRIRIKNFGPIKEGYTENDGWLEINSVCVFIGTQGSGKSTIAKLISTVTWLEKALFRGDFGSSKLSFSRFKEHLEYQNILSYLTDGSEIDYQGEAYEISYRNRKITTRKHDGDTYSFPKIMYVPSERNLVSSVSNVNDLEGLPKPLYEFSREYDAGLRESDGLISLPINNSKLEYRVSNKKTYLSGDDYVIELNEASSGFQSLVPLYLVSDYLANALNDEGDKSRKNISINRENRLRKEVEKILSNTKLSEDVRRASLEFLSSGIAPSAFINIVEEPEQNLFPSSQSQLLNTLLEIKRRNDKSKLILTTHSPYIINFLSIAIQAGTLLKNDLPATLLKKLRNIVPEKAELDAHEVSVFQLNIKKGTIEDLSNFEGIPSDKNYLNQFLDEGNIQFDTLLEIEQEL